MDGKGTGKVQSFKKELWGRRGDPTGVGLGAPLLEWGAAGRESRRGAGVGAAQTEVKAAQTEAGGWAPNPGSRSTGIYGSGIRLRQIAEHKRSPAELVPPAWRDCTPRRWRTEGCPSPTSLPAGCGAGQLSGRWSPRQRLELPQVSKMAKEGLLSPLSSPKPDESDKDIRNSEGNSSLNRRTRLLPAWSARETQFPGTRFVPVLGFWLTQSLAHLTLGPLKAGGLRGRENMTMTRPRSQAPPGAEDGPEGAGAPCAASARPAAPPPGMG